MTGHLTLKLRLFDSLAGARTEEGRGLTPSWDSNQISTGQFPAPAHLIHMQALPFSILTPVIVLTCSLRLPPWLNYILGKIPDHFRRWLARPWTKLLDGRSASNPKPPFLHYISVQPDKFVGHVEKLRVFAAA